MDYETIAAIATGSSNAGISIIRISGPKAIELCDSIFVSVNGKKLADVKSHTMHYGKIVSCGQPLDEVLVSVMKAPNTYTREDVVEINCHGGIIVTKKIFEAVILAGARIAEPGEFTKRAFLNGRIDLSQAEAVMDIINATNERAVKNSLSQLSGKLRDRIVSIREKILYETAYIEHALDDPEHVSLDGFSEELEKTTDTVLEEVDKLIKGFKDGKIIKEGIKTVILGKPNAGKSTLLNALIGDDRAIVTDIPGTTRDTLEELVNLNGVPLRLIDTAGIRETDDVVEKIGVEKALETARDADLIVYVADASGPLTDEDEKLIDFIKTKNTIVLLNKSDLNMALSSKYLEDKTGKKVFVISAKEESGIEQIGKEIFNMFSFGTIDKSEDVYVSNLRHLDELKNAKNSLLSVKESIVNNMPEDFYSIDLLDAYAALGRIIGEEVEDDLADKIFRDFCTGK